MSTLQLEMHRVMQVFVEQIARIAQRAAIESLQAAFAPGTPHSKVRIVALPSGLPRGRPRGHHGEKRSADDIAAASSRFVAFVRQNPGLRIEQINKGLGTTTKDLALPVRKLIADGVIRPKGQKRATTYFTSESARN